MNILNDKSMRHWEVYTRCVRKVSALHCRLFFSIVRVLCTTNLLQEVRRSTKNITLKFWRDCVMPWKENDCVSSQAMTGFFTTIPRQRIHWTLCSNFWQNTRMAKHCTRHLIVNYFDSCSIGVLMFSYIFLTCCTKVCVSIARKPYCSFTQVIRVVMNIFDRSL